MFNKAECLLIGLIMALSLPAYLVAQTTCPTALSIQYSTQYPDYHNFQFSGTDLWLAFQADSNGKAFFSIESPSNAGGAIIESLTIYQGDCNYLQVVTSVAYTSNDSLSTSVTGLQISQTYKVKLTRTIINGCDSCYRNIAICLTSFRNSIPAGMTFYDCQACFGGPLVYNGNFDLTTINPPGGAVGFSTNYLLVPFAINSHGYYVVAENTTSLSGNSGPIFYAASGYPSSSNNKFFMCDLSKDNQSPVMWQQSLSIPQGRTNILTFYVTNLGKSSYGPFYSPPRIEVQVNNIVIPASNVYIPQVPGPFYYVDIDNDEQWHPLCYQWINESENETVTIRQLNYSNTSNGLDVGIDYIRLFAALDPPQVTTQNATVCRGAGIDLGTLVQVSGTQPFMYQWNNLSAPSPSSTNVVSPYATTTFQVTVTDNLGCSSIGQLTIFVETNLPAFSIEGFNNNCTQIATYSASINDQNLFYTWSVGCPPGTTCGTITGSTSGYGLSSITVQWDQTNFPSLPQMATLQVTITNTCDVQSASLSIFKCCDIPGMDITYNNQTLTSTTEWSGKYIAVNGTLHVMGSLTIKDHSSVYMGAMAKIVVHPDANLIVEGDVEFDLLCHTYMWDGIYTQSPSGSVSFTSNSTGFPYVEGAINGIVSENGGRIHIYNSTFQLNFNAIQVKKYGIGSPYYYGPMDVSIYGCTFNCFSSGATHPYLLQAAPYYDQQPNAAIFTDQVESLTIGSTFEQKNIFLNMRRGIFSVNSSISVEHAEFNHMPPFDNYVTSWPFREAAILAVTNDGKNLMQIHPGLVVNGGTASNITFNHCVVGISAQKTKASVTHCSFTDCTTPVHLLEVRFPSEVSYNSIQKGSLNQTYDIRGTGISAISANPSADTEPLKLQITNNVISGMRNGIHCLNQNNVVHFPPKENCILDNEIHFQASFQPQTGETRNGIRVENCDGINIFGNQVDFIANSVNMNLSNRGLWISRSPGSYAAYNHFTKVDAGIYTTGELQNTLFFCNVFEDNYNGFFFGPFTAMTDQILFFNDNFYCPNNEWLGHYTQGSGNLNQYRLTQDAFNLNLSNNFKYYYDPLAGQEYEPDADLISLETWHPCTGFINTPTHLDNESICSFVDSFRDTTSQGIDTTHRGYLFRDIVSESVLYDLLINQNRFYEKDYLFTFLLHHKEIIDLGGDDDDSYQQFIDNLYNTDIDYMLRIYKFLQDKRLDSASFYNDMISNAFTWTDNRRTVNDIYFSTWSVDTTVSQANDSLSLLGIALQTPYAGGDGVYTARCLLNLLDVEPFGTPYRATVASPYFQKLSIWPNPASTMVTVEIPETDCADLQMEIRNAAGNLFRVIPVTNKTTQWQLPIDGIPNGFYLCRLTSGNNVLGIGKLCVIR